MKLSVDLGKAGSNGVQMAHSHRLRALETICITQILDRIPRPKRNVIEGHRRIIRRAAPADKGHLDAATRAGQVDTASCARVIDRASQRAKEREAGRRGNLWLGSPRQAMARSQKTRPKGRAMRFSNGEAVCLRWKEIRMATETMAM